MHSGSSKTLPTGEAPFLATVGVRIAAVSAARARLELPYRDENANRNGSLHGGVVAATIDIAAATVATAGIDPTRRAGASTIDFTVHYLAPAAISEGQQPDDVLSLVRFLIGPEGRNLTGQSIAVDGGRWMAP